MRSTTPTRARAGPHSHRISKLSERLGSLQAEMDYEKQSRNETTFNRVKALEALLNDQIKDAQTRMGSIQRDVDEIAELVEIEHLRKDEINEQKNAELMGFESGLHKILDEEMETRRENEGNLLRECEEQLRSFNAMIREEMAKKSSNVEELRHILEEDMTSLQKHVSDFRNDSGEAFDTMIAKVNNDIANLNAEINQEKKNREDGEEQILEKLKNTIDQMNSEIEQESKSREASHAMMVELLEDTCKKLNTSMSV